MKRRSVFRFATPILFMLVPCIASADLYSYTDKDGVTHFTNRPNGNGAYKLYLKSEEKKSVSTENTSSNITESNSSADRFSRYDDWIKQASSLYHIPEELVRAVIKIESDYNLRAQSRVGAQGLMQLMPQTALRMQVRDSFDPRENIFGGTRYLRVLANMFSGNLELTIAGYNAGEGAILKYGGIPPYDETQKYVTLVLEQYYRYKSLKQNK